MFSLKKPISLKERANSVANGVFLLLLAFLFYTGAWWPGILFAIFISFVIREVLCKRWSRILLGLTFLVILFLVTWNDKFVSALVPAMLVTIGLWMIGKEFILIDSAPSDENKSLKK